MLLRPCLNESGSCAGYLFEYLAAAAAVGSPIAAVFETRIVAAHRSGRVGAAA